jgi:hypothetical protein
MAAILATPRTSPLLRRTADDQNQGLREHQDAAGGACLAGGLGLVSDVNHLGLAP